MQRSRGARAAARGGFFISAAAAKFSRAAVARTVTGQVPASGRKPRVCDPGYQMRDQRRGSSVCRSAAGPLRRLAWAARGSRKSNVDLSRAATAPRSHTPGMPSDLGEGTRSKKKRAARWQHPQHAARPPPTTCRGAAAAVMRSRCRRIGHARLAAPSRRCLAASRAARLDI
jgi:hypothetical protein